MCHLCTKLLTLQKTTSPALTKPISLLLEKLYQKISPHLGDFWLWRLNWALEMQTLIQNTEGSIPGGRIALRELLEDVEKQILHIKMNMVKHPPRKSTGRLHELKEEIWPRESASGGEDGGRVRWEEGEELRMGEGGLSMEERVGARNDDRQREGSTSSRGMENKHQVRFLLAERKGTPIHPSLAIQAASIKRVFAWLTEYNEAMEGEGQVEQEDERDSVVSLDGIDVQRPQLEVKLGTRVKTALTSSLSRLGRSTTSRSERGNGSTVHESTINTYESSKQSENINPKNHNARKEAVQSQEEGHLLCDPFSGKDQSIGPRLSKAKERAMDALRTVAGGRRMTTSTQYHSDDDSSSSESFFSSRASEINLGSIIEKSRPPESDFQRRRLRETRTTSASKNKTKRIFEHLEKQHVQIYGRPLSGDSFVPVAPEPLPRKRAHKYRVRHQYSGDSFVPTAPKPLPLKEESKENGSRSSSHCRFERPLPPLPDSTNKSQTRQPGLSEGIQHRREGENILDEGKEIMATKIARIAVDKGLNEKREAFIDQGEDRRREGRGAGGDEITARRYSGSRRRAERISPGESADLLATSRNDVGKAPMGKSREFIPESSEGLNEGNGSGSGSRGASDNVLRRRAERAREKARDYNVTERAKYWGQ